MPDATDPRVFGARGDGAADDTASLQRAIDACAAGGGGVVRLAEGVFRSGTVELRSGVTLRVEAGAVLRGLPDADRYRAVSPEEADVAALVIARECRDIGLDGGGTIEGPAPHCWQETEEEPERGHARWNPEARRWVGHRAETWPTARIVTFLRCEGARIRGLRLTKSPRWTVHLAGCRDVAVERVTIDNPAWGPNTDGIDLDGTSDVVIRDCVIQTADDGICLKTKRTFRLTTPVRNVTVSGCRIRSACNAFKIGTETIDPVERIRFLDSVVENPVEASEEMRGFAAVAIETVDGGEIRDVLCRAISVTNPHAGFFVRRGERLRRKARAEAGTLRDVVIEDLRVEGALRPSVIAGLPGKPVEGVRVERVRMTLRGGGGPELAARKEIPEKPRGYPEVPMFGRLPAAACWARHVRGLALSDWEVTVAEPDARPLFLFDDAGGAVADGIRFDPARTGGLRRDLG
jgi:polygalacturonase